MLGTLRTTGRYGLPHMTITGKEAKALGAAAAATTAQNSEGVFEQGTVLFFSATKGYGRIKRGQGTVFFGAHDSAITGAHFEVGDKVQFVASEDHDGRPKAILVKHVM